MDNDAKRKPLGSIELETGRKDIFPTNDFFLSYLFDNPEYWEALRLIVNIIITKYLSLVPESRIEPIEGDIEVKTQYKIITDRAKTAKVQDLRVESAKNITYVEVQNSAMSKPPIATRAIEYFGISLGNNRSKDVTQMWILAEDVDGLLHGEAYTNYILSDEKSGIKYPLNNNLMFVSLKRLALGDDEGAELARFLLGKDSLHESATVKKVAELFGKGFTTFIDDREAINSMSVVDKMIYEAEERSLEKGREEGVEKGKIETAIEMFEDGFDVERIARYVKLPVEKLKEVLDAYKLENQ